MFDEKLKTKLKSIKTCALVLLNEFKNLNFNVLIEHVNL